MKLQFWFLYYAGMHKAGADIITMISCAAFIILALVTFTL